ncbi:hypothetical protein K493DRAFT_379412 [Basidiobolus meristosporus CBS 931.73]|uniref:Uncharacterized protein n=1 Tax=Basidiobolus meristosporus CBS 931.73 TaxID=1314790 RepID=A0A1Y1XZG0_9FUNG|nr:hypothetical protein K493DRAFT_379412 [Basidiobolus meristosporus CBS 931.73]|eukprot:ORX91121.1 hypothetical protein K493DRAFT_379412 [Basidiobolus meristosporus CBS 931.73]
MIRGEQLKQYIEESLQYDVRDVEQFYSKTKASKISFTLDLEHQLNVVHSSSDLVAEILVSWLSSPETQALLRKHLSERLTDKVLSSLPEGYFVEKKPKQFDIPLHPGSYKRRELREYVAKSWQYLTGVSRPNYTNPKKRPKNMPKHIPWKDPLFMSIPQLRLASQWLSYIIDGITAKRISPDQFRDSGIDDSVKAEVIKGIRTVKKSDKFKLNFNKSEIPKFTDSIMPPILGPPIARDYMVSSEGPRRVSCDVIRWDGSCPAFNIQSNNQDPERNERSVRDSRPRSMSNIEIGEVQRASGRESLTANEPYQPFHTLSFSSKSLKSSSQVLPLANQGGLQFVMKPVNQLSMQTLPFKVKPSSEVSNAQNPSNGDSLEQNDLPRSSQYQFVAHQVSGRDAPGHQPPAASNYPIPGALPPVQTPTPTSQPLYGSHIIPAQDTTGSPKSEGGKQSRKNSVAKSPKKKRKKSEEFKITLPPPATNGPRNRRLSLGAKAGDSASTQFVFVSYPERRASVSSVANPGNAPASVLAPSNTSHTSTSSFSGGSGPDGKVTPSGSPEPAVHQDSSPTTKESPKSLTFHNFVPPSDGVATRAKTRKKSLSGGKKRQFAFSEYMKSSPS